MKRWTRHGSLLVLAVTLSVGTAAVSAVRQGQVQVLKPERLPDGVRLGTRTGFLTLHVISDAIVRVTFAPTRDFSGDRMVVLGPETAALNPFRSDRQAKPAAGAPRWTIRTTDKGVTLNTAKLQVLVDSDGTVTFADQAGRTLLAEAAGGRRLVPATIQGTNTHHVQQIWKSDPDESLYGLGQRQEGKLNIKGFDFDLWQRNTVVYIPLVVSSRGYGLLWDNTSPSKFGDIAPFTPIPADHLIDMAGRAGGLTEGAFASESGDIQGSGASSHLEIQDAGGGAPAASSSRGWQGQIVVPTTDDYQFQTYSNGWTRLWLGGTVEIDHYKQNWATEYDQFKMHLVAGQRYPIKIANRLGTTLKVTWKPAAATTDTSMWSESGEGIDYYFLYGPEIDRVIGGYRTLTGRASMLPDWAFGFWQSKNKYNTQNEVLSTLAEFRRREIPIDTIVQDWQYWPPDRWGDHEFEASRYPDAAAMIRSIHDQHAHFMVSVWGKFYPVTDNYKALASIDGLYLRTISEHTRDWLNHEYAFYDVFNATARRMFWAQVNRALFTKGVDAWWMDATEPDLVQPSPPTLETTAS